MGECCTALVAVAWPGLAWPMLLLCVSYSATAYRARLALLTEITSPALTALHSRNIVKILGVISSQFTRRTFDDVNLNKIQRTIICSPAKYHYSAPVGERSIVIVCLSVCLSASISLEPPDRSSRIFRADPSGRGSVILWRRCDT